MHSDRRPGSSGYCGNGQLVDWHGIRSRATDGVRASLADSPQGRLGIWNLGRIALFPDVLCHARFPFLIPFDPRNRLNYHGFGATAKHTGGIGISRQESAYVSTGSTRALKGR